MPVGYWPGKSRYVEERADRVNAEDFDGVEAAAAVRVRHAIPGTTFNLCGRLAATRTAVQKGGEVSAGTLQNLLGAGKAACATRTAWLQGRLPVPQAEPDAHPGRRKTINTIAGKPALV